MCDMCETFNGGSSNGRTEDFESSNVGSSPAPPTIVAKYTIGESVSWHLGSDKDGYAIPIYEEDEETVKRFYKNWNNPK